VILAWCPAPDRHIFGYVRDLVKPLAFLYVAVQLLLAVPAGASAGALAQAGMHQNPCEHMAVVPAQGDHCPCCPDGTSSVRDCLASCTLAATMSVSLMPVPATPERAQAASVLACAIPSASEPPLKPPPIS
jgi:hypothetical protein